MMRPGRRLIPIALLAVVLLGSATAAQQFGRGRGVRARMASDLDFDGRFNFCRLMYTSVVREEGGAGWSTDYPGADQNLSVRLSELTKTAVSRRLDGEPNHLVVRATDPQLFQCPWVQMSDGGTAGFSDEEVLRLREYLLKGGFLWADDFWGDAALDHLSAELSKVLPSDTYPVREIPLSHSMFRTMFNVSKLPQIPSIRIWRPFRVTSERGAETATVHFKGIQDAEGRLMVLMTHNTDVADAWEREGEDQDYFRNFSPDGYAVGINVLLYTMTH
jgi:Domain of unknown function (DUF4159)